ncbi:MerR family transcriptional regulator [Rhodococcoides kyotonense]|uniref:MerR HTH family regulatory protein n=1 Tax=Rhodococcoides kyotonense TaxID=398843 RepID=A0A239FBB3_9NOCA|nr:MerR family transcriptional regulator [Rhodococcus kyotonensis]SNS54021.1 MerR HTH family regulatory protein [Rhodococcus kyotonensis]
MEYRIDELAHAAGTTTRNVRAYRERGLLPPPEKRGRVGIYDDSHLARLRLIDLLLQRGFTTSHIGDFISGWENGKDLAEVLGLQNAVTEQWATSDAVEIPLSLVDEHIGGELPRLQSLGLARIEGDTCVFTDPELLRGFSSLTGHGFSVGQLLDVHERIHAAVDGIAKDMIRTAERHIVDRHGEGWLPGADEVSSTAAMLTEMRSLAVHSVNAVLARTLDDNLQRELGDYLTTAVRNRSAPETLP